jgi:hypothetical protein
VNNDAPKTAVMPITRTSILSHKERTFLLPVTPEQLQAYYNGMLLQDAFPHLTADQREFIKTGITADEWDALFNV